MKHLIAVSLTLSLAVFATGCVAATDDSAPPPFPSVIAPIHAASAPQLAPTEVGPRTTAPAPEVPDAHACVDEGCPAALTCDWVQGCVTEVAFCCADEQCGEGRYCNFDAGGLCTAIQ